MKEKEEERLKLLKQEENRLYESGKVERICGIDEAGRRTTGRACCCGLRDYAERVGD